MKAYGPELPPADYTSSAGAKVVLSRESMVLKGHDGPVLAVRFDTTGQYCLSCGKVCLVLCIGCSLFLLEEIRLKSSR